MLRIFYTPGFLRAYDDLPDSLKEEVRERIELLRNNPRLPSLRTHKLKGILEGRWSCRVNYRYRIIFCYDAEDTVALLAVGTHDIYQ